MQPNYLLCYYDLLYVLYIDVMMCSVVEVQISPNNEINFESFIPNSITQLMLHANYGMVLLQNSAILIQWQWKVFAVGFHKRTIKLHNVP